jgi:hypothetical protein
MIQCDTYYTQTLMRRTSPEFPVLPDILAASNVKKMLRSMLYERLSEKNLQLDSQQEQKLQAYIEQLQFFTDRHKMAEYWSAHLDAAIEHDYGEKLSLLLHSVGLAFFYLYFYDSYGIFSIMPGDQILCIGVFTTGKRQNNTLHHELTHACEELLRLLDALSPDGLETQTQEWNELYHLHQRQLLIRLAEIETTFAVVLLELVRINESNAIALLCIIFGFVASADFLTLRFEQHNPVEKRAKISKP